MRGGDLREGLQSASASPSPHPGANVRKLETHGVSVRGLPSDEGDQAIVGAIISLGLALGVEIVAVGTEDAKVKYLLAY